MTIFLNKKSSWHICFDNFQLLLMRSKFRLTEKTFKISCLAHRVNNFLLPKNVLE